MSRTALLDQLDSIMMRLVKTQRRQDDHAVCISHALDKVLMIIGLHTPALNIKQLAHILGVTSGAATQHVATLEEDGYVNRSQNPENRRETSIVVTDKGEIALDHIHANHQRMLQELFGGLDEGELSTLVRLFEKAITTYTNKELS